MTPREPSEQRSYLTDAERAYIASRRWCKCGHSEGFHAEDHCAGCGRYAGGSWICPAFREDDER